MSEIDDPMLSLGALSTDASANINEDITWASEYLESSPRKASESVFSNFRGSLDGGSSIINAFNILKQGASEEEERVASAFSPLGPNSIFELTVASDAARVRLNRGLKHQITVNGGATTVYNLTKPTNKDIPQIQLHSLKQKVNNAQLTDDLVTKVQTDYKGFELSYKALTEEVLMKFSEQQLRSDGGSDSEWMGDPDEEGSDVIPKIFEDEEFRLDDPRVFRQVMENSQILPDPESHQSSHIIHNTEVQEKISKYLDQVEIQLIHEISKTSDSFFSTLGDIQTIKEHSADCLSQYHNIMTKMAELEDGQAKKGLEILDLLDERKSIDYLENSVIQVQLVVSNFHKASQLYQEGKNSECLNQIVVIENLIAGVEREDYTDPESFKLYPKLDYPLVSLKQLPALKGLRRDLQQLKYTCSQGYIKNFVDLLLQNLRSHYTATPTEDTMNRIYISIDRTRKYNSDPVNRLFNNIDPEFKKDLQNFISNLSKSGQLVQAFDDYQDKIIAEVKSIIRNGLPESARDISESHSNDTSRASSYPPGAISHESTPMANANGGTLSNNIRNLTAQGFNDMMQNIYASLSECLRRLTMHQKLLLDLSLSSLSPAAAQQIDVMALDITNAINKAIELTQVRLVKVLNVRLEQLGDLLVKDYLSLYLITSAYLLECESIYPGYVATGTGSSLTEWVKSHVTYYLHKFHSNSIKKFAQLCDKETWKECTALTEIQAAQSIVDQLIGYSTFVKTDGAEGFDGKVWMKLLDFYKTDSKEDTPPDVPSKEPSSDLPRLAVGEVGFLVPSLVTKIVDNIRDYIIVSKIFNSRAAQVESYLLTFLKVVNSRISQAILNAGATRTAGLKHITTKHLALCIQTIEFFIALLEEIQLIFKNHHIEFDQTNQGNEDQSFSNTISHFRDHEKELFSKLVSIMHDRTLNHCNAITKLDLSQPLKHPQQCHPYMEVLVKETTTVAKVLGKYLQEKECSYILLQIFDNYKKLLVNCFCTELSQFKDFNEKHSLLKDVDYFRVKLSEIPGYGNSGQVIWENVNSLPTIEDARMDEIMQNNIKSEIDTAAANSARASMEAVKEATQVSNPENKAEVTIQDKPSDNQTKAVEDHAASPIDLTEDNKTASEINPKVQEPQVELSVESAKPDDVVENLEEQIVVTTANKENDTANDVSEDEPSKGSAPLSEGEPEVVFEVPQDIDEERDEKTGEDTK